MKYKSEKFFPRWIAFTAGAILSIFIIFGAWFFQVQEKQQHKFVEANLPAIAISMQARLKTGGEKDFLMLEFLWGE